MSKTKKQLEEENRDLRDLLSDVLEVYNCEVSVVLDRIADTLDSESGDGQD